MRMILFDLAPKDLDIIRKVKDFGQNTWMVTQDIYEDIIACLCLGPESMHHHLVSFDTLYEESANLFANVKGIKYNELLEQLFNCRRDVVEFAAGDLLRDLYEDRVLLHEEKVEILLEGIVNVLENMFNPQDPNVPKSSPMDSRSPYKAFGDILSSLSPPSRRKNGGAVSSRGASYTEPDLEKDQAKKLYKNLMRLMGGLFSANKQDLFVLAQKFNISLKSKDGSAYRDVFIGNSLRFRKMHKLSEIRNISPIEWALPDQAFDIKLAKKNFLVRQPTDKYEKSQLIYVLSDRSGSMKTGARELFVKAIMLSMGKNCVARNGKLYSRWFNDKLTGLRTLSKREHWYDFVNDTIEKPMVGSTDLHHALYTAGEDIKNNEEVFDETEIIVVTDGTVYVDADEIHHRINIPIHVVLLAYPKDKTCLDSYRRAFDTVIIAQASNLQEALSVGMQLINVA